jgi:hypothetical protein
MVPGAGDPRSVSNQIRENVDLAHRVGAQLGAILAEQHTRIDATMVAGWLPRTPSWPESLEWIQERLASVVNDPKLIEDATIVIANYEAIPIADNDRALVHTDVGFHNLGIDTSSHTVNGLYDYADAAWADRHHDFRFLVFHSERCDLLDSALSVYEPTMGRSIDQDRVFLYNAACAITFLAYRVGTSNEERSCGRTLKEDLEWSRNAIARALKGRSTSTPTGRATNLQNPPKNLAPREKPNPTRHL